MRCRRHQSTGRCTKACEPLTETAAQKIQAAGLPAIEPVALPRSQAALPTTLSYELLARRPDLQAMRWYVEASFDRIDAAKAAFYPSFDIKAFFGFNALHLYPPARGFKAARG